MTMTNIILGSFFFQRLLEELGWPRKEGMFFNRKEVVNSMIAHLAFQQTKDFGIRTGVNQPEIAIKCLALNFFPGFFDEGMPEETEKYLNEQAIIEIDQGATLIEGESMLSNDSIPWEDLNSEKLGMRIKTAFIFALWYGLTRDPDNISYSTQVPIDSEMDLHVIEGYKIIFGDFIEAPDALVTYFTNKEKE